MPRRGNASLNEGARKAPHDQRGETSGQQKCDPLLIQLRHDVLAEIDEEAPNADLGPDIKELRDDGPPQPAMAQHLERRSRTRWARSARFLQLREACQLDGQGER